MTQNDSKSLKTHNLRKVLPIYAQNKSKVIWICFFIILTGMVIYARLALTKKKKKEAAH